MNIEKELRKKNEMNFDVLTHNEKINGHWCVTEYSEDEGKTWINCFTPSKEELTIGDIQNVCNELSYIYQHTEMSYTQRIIILRTIKIIKDYVLKEG